MMILEKPYTIEEIKSNMVDGRITGDILIDKKLLVNMGFESTLTVLSECLTGSPLLTDIKYKRVGSYYNNDIVRVSGNPRKILNDVEKNYIVVRAINNDPTILNDAPTDKQSAWEMMLEDLLDVSGHIQDAYKEMKDKKGYCHCERPSLKFVIQDIYAWAKIGDNRYNWAIHFVNQEGNIYP